MSAKRTRPRRAPAQQPAPDPVQLEVDDNSAELAALWRVMPDALARDSAGQMTGDRHPSGAVQGSPASVNLSVVEASVLIEASLTDVAEQAARILNLADPPSTVLEVIAALPDWHRNLENRRMPLAKHLRQDLAAWVREAGGAVGTRRHDRKLGALCPEHRDEKPAPLLQVGERAQLTASLIAGPPSTSRVLDIGPTCGSLIFVVGEQCGHQSCRAIRDRRLVDERGVPTDWLLTRDGDAAWCSLAGDAAMVWTTSTTIRCPHCKSTWSTTAERRVLARRLAELGDAEPDAAALIR